MASDPLHNPPSELDSYFARAESIRRPDLRINPLSHEESVAISEQLREIPAWGRLGLVVLDDANDSNPFCLIGYGVARGRIVHLTHDSEPRITHLDINSFTNRLLAAIAAERDIDDIAVDPPQPLSPQEPLSNELTQLHHESTEDAEALVCILIPLLAPEALAEISLLASNQSEYVREELAQFIARHPLPSHRPVAQSLAADTNAQVRAAGTAALSAVHRQIHG